MVAIRAGQGIEVRQKLPAGCEHVLTPEVLAFLADLHRHFDQRRLELLKARNKAVPHFLSETREIRDNPNWHVAVPPRDLQRRLVEITGPTDRKMVINALNSGADVFMADFEDANSPTWSNLIEGQQNLTEAIAGTLTYQNPEGKKYSLNAKQAVLMVRPRGWHLPEAHVWIDGAPMSGSLFDFGIYFFRNVQALLTKGTGPYFYLPKMESHYEARLWNDVFIHAEQTFDLPRGTIRATVLIETISAAFEMEEILWELREHITGLNAGRWDYLFSIIKRFSGDQKLVFPDRSLLTMTVPFMRAYAQLLVQTCHKRKAHAMGGMAAFIPSRKDAEVNQKALTKVREDKLREVGDGFDGTWVAHPDLVEEARKEFVEVMGDLPHQKERSLNETKVTERELLNFAIPGPITEQGVRSNIEVTLIYLDSWLRGIGAVAIHNLMEDAATAEISRSQLWQWVHHPDAKLTDGRRISSDLVNGWIEEEFTSLSTKSTKDNHLTQAKALLKKLVNDEHFADFLTTEAYKDLEV